eukprot:Skav229096  [mRNA]  locus=scaffold92:257786:258481:- [translate_table: standard]
MAGWAFFKQYYSFGISLLVCFYGMLRTGELLQLKSSRILCSGRQRQALLSLGFTKGGKRHGAAESVVLGFEDAYRFLQRWKNLASPHTTLTPSPPKWRRLFNEAISALKLEELQFRPYSLRRGGATFFFQKHQSMDKVMVQGRWHSQKSARIYLHEGLAVLAQMRLPMDGPNLKPFLDVYRNTSRLLNFRTLEPPPKGGRGGGRGGTKKKGRKERKERLFHQKFLVWKLPK